MTKSKLIGCLVFFGFVWLALTLDGCATATNIKTTSELSRVGKDSSIVFGQIEWLEDGKQKYSEKDFWATAEPILMKMEDNHPRSTIRGEVNEGGQFVWSLEAGEYLIHKIVYSNRWTGNQTYVPKVAFNVPENGKIYYIGTLRCESDQASGGVRCITEDDSNRNFSTFQDKFNIASEEIEKSLMVHDERNPISVADTLEAVNFIFGTLTLLGQTTLLVVGY